MSAIICDRERVNFEIFHCRAGFLAILCANSTVVKLYDIRHSVIGTDELEPVTFERNILCKVFIFMSDFLEIQSNLWDFCKNGSTMLA